VDNSSCVILVPAAHYIEPHCELSLRQLEGLGYPVRRVYGFSQIDVARNRIASDALADGYPELMWIDSDMASAQRELPPRPLTGGTALPSTAVKVCYLGMS
jgi:hypothetical protein